MHFNTVCRDKHVTQELCIQKHNGGFLLQSLVKTDATICAAQKSCGCKGDFRDGPAQRLSPLFYVYQQLQTQQVLSIGVAEEKKRFSLVFCKFCTGNLTLSYWWTAEMALHTDSCLLAHLICNMHTSRNRTISALTACRLSFVQPAAEIKCSYRDLMNSVISSYVFGIFLSKQRRN